MRPGRADLYDWECRHVHGRSAQDVGFWLDIAASCAGGPVLELACGTGRIAVPLADAGVRIVGLDHDHAMLAALARRRRGDWPLVVASDMRNFALAGRFAAVIVAYNSIQLLTEWSDIVACLVCARRHLAPGGVIGLEVTDFQALAADGPVEEELLGQAEGVRLDGSLVHELASRTSTYRRRFTAQDWAFEDEIALRSLDLHELVMLFGAAAIEATRWWSDGPTLRVIARASGNE